MPTDLPIAPIFLHIVIGTRADAEAAAVYIDEWGVERDDGFILHLGRVVSMTQWRWINKNARDESHSLFSMRTLPVLLFVLFVTLVTNAHQPEHEIKITGRPRSLWMLPVAAILMLFALCVILIVVGNVLSAVGMVCLACMPKESLLTELMKRGEREEEEEDNTKNV